jgi:RND family efflux transporter MFP subunit
MNVSAYPLRLAASSLFVSLMGSTMLIACAPKETTVEPVRAVRTLTLGATPLESRQEFAAEVRARTESSLGFRVGGKLISRPVNNGDVVQAGQTLAQLDAADLRLAQQAARAGQDAAQTNLDQLEADLRRYRDLREQGFIGAAELERRDAAAKAARSQLDQARAQAMAQANQAGYASLVASVSGVITQVAAEPGQVLAAGSPVVKLAHDGPRDAVFSVPEDKVAVMRALLGKPGAVQLQLWNASEATPATVHEVAAAADPMTRTFLVKADIGTAAARLGQTATVRVTAGPAEPAFRLPLDAVLESGGHSQVFLFDRAAGRVRLQPITVATADGNLVVVSQGLKRGDEVVVAGTHVLTNGQSVRPYIEPQAGGAAASAAVAR